MYNWGRAVIISISVLFLLLCFPCSADVVGSGGATWSGNVTFDNTSETLAGNAKITNFISQDDFENVLFNNRSNLTIPTYDGSGEAIHPDIYYNVSGWNGYKYWMSMTPYPSSSEADENPSIVVCNDSYTWVVPSGGSNPIDAQPAPGYNSDPNLAFKNNELYCYYREVNATYNILRMRNSTDGTSWGSEYTSLALPNHQLVSPAIEYNSTDDMFYMWCVDSGASGHTATETWVLLRNSTDGVNWDSSENCTISIPNHVIWHINVEYVSEIDEYWMVISAGTSTATTSNELFFAYSSDKINWIVLPGKVIGKGTIGGWDDNQIYQAATKYIDGTLKLWYSANDGTHWNMGYAETSAIDIKKDYKWNFIVGTERGYFNRSSNQVMSESYSGRFEHVGTDDTNIVRNVTTISSDNITFEIDFYDDGDTSAMKMFRVKSSGGSIVGMGVWTGSSITNYTYHNTAYTYSITSVSRSVGWHRLRIFIKSDSSIKFYIDDAEVGTLTAQFNNPIYSQLSGYLYDDNFYVDNLNVYQYITGNITRDYTSIMGGGDELKNLKYNGTTPTSDINVNIYASTDGATYTLIQSNASINTNYDVSGNGYKYGRWKLNTINTSLTPVIYNISAEVTVVGAGYTMSGTIYGAAGLGEGQVTVTLGSDSTTTSSTGAYSFTGVSAGTYTLTASKPGLQDASTTITVSSDTTQDLTMARAVSPAGGGQESSDWWLPFNISGPISRLDGLFAPLQIPSDSGKINLFWYCILGFGAFMFIDGTTFRFDNSRKAPVIKLKYLISAPLSLILMFLGLLYIGLINWNSVFFINTFDGLGLSFSSVISTLLGVTSPLGAVGYVLVGTGILVLGVLFFIDGLAFCVDKSRENTFLKIKYQVLIAAGLGLGVLGAVVSGLVIFY